MLNKFKIRQKFILIGFLALFSLSFLGWLSYKINKQNYYDLESLFSEFTEIQNIQTSLIDPLFLIREKSLILAMSPNKKIKSKANIELMQQLEELDYSFKNLPENILEYWKLYKNEVIKTRTLVIKNYINEAYINATTSEKKQFFYLVNSLKSYQNRQLLDSENNYLDAIIINKQSSSYLISGFLLIGLVSFLFNMSIVMRIVNGIEKVEAGLKSFFIFLSQSSKSKVDIFIDICTKDELGIMAKAINKQVEVIQSSIEKDYKLIEEATHVVNEVYNCRFGNRLTSFASSKELETLKNVMNSMMDQLEAKIQKEIDVKLSQEKILIQQTKLAEMGNMLGNIAHQWRQPISEISAILMSTEVMLRCEKLDTKVFIKNIDLCNKITGHMSQTISDFQNFFKPSKEKEKFDVYEECKHAESIIEASYKSHNIELEFNTEEIPLIIGYPREFAHAILNILSNCKDVFLEREVINPKVILTIKSGKKNIIIKIEDNAGGIKLKDINSIFEPYFTTKHARQGTGIGLHMTKVMIEKNMEGIVTVRNNERGACFVIKLKKEHEG